MASNGFVHVSILNKNKKKQKGNILYKVEIINCRQIGDLSPNDAIAIYWPPGHTTTPQMIND